MTALAVMLAQSASGSIDVVAAILNLAGVSLAIVSVTWVVRMVRSGEMVVESRAKIEAELRQRADDASRREEALIHLTAQHAELLADAARREDRLWSLVTHGTAAKKPPATG